MRRFSVCVGCLAIVLVLLLLPLGTAVRAGFTQGQSLVPDTSVNSLTVRLKLADATNLSEPLALDLGLGFPFWLPPSDVPMSSLPFGAIPRTTASVNDDAGSTLEFTFRRSGEAGNDGLHASPQLLAGVRVSDIARIAFSNGEGEYTKIAGYELLVNGNVLAANDEVKPNVDDSSDAATVNRDTDAQEIQKRLRSVEQLLANLCSLDEAGRLAAGDRNRIVALHSQRAALMTEVQAVYTAALTRPWFVESQWRPMDEVQPRSNR